jgi:hypothetical protein
MRARLVAAGNPRTALDQVVAAVEGGRGEVVVDGVYVETVEGVDRRLGPLPHVADHVEEVAVGERVDRTGLEAQWSRCRLAATRASAALRSTPAASYRRYHSSSVGRRTGWPVSCGLPAAEGARFVAVGFGRPVPGHRHFFEHQAQVPAVVPAHPEGGRVRPLGVGAPAQRLPRPTMPRRRSRRPRRSRGIRGCSPGSGWPGRPADGFARGRIRCPSRRSGRRSWPDA